MEEIRSSGERGSGTLERCARVRRGLGRVMAAAKALPAGEIEAARHEIAEVRGLDVFASDVMEALEQIDTSLQQGQTRRAAAELQTVAGAMREELLRCAEAARDAAPQAAFPAARERAVTGPRRPLDPETAPSIEPETAPSIEPATAPAIEPATAPAIAIARPQSFVPDAARALALAQLLGKAEEPRRTKRMARRIPAAYVIAAGSGLLVASAILLVRGTDRLTFFDAARQPRAIVTQPTVAGTSGKPLAPPPVAQTPTRETDVSIALSPPAAETDVAIALPARGTLSAPKQGNDVASRAIDVTAAAGTERPVVTPRPQPAPNVQRAAAPPTLPEPLANLRAPVEELPVPAARIDPASANPAGAPATPTAPSDAVEIQRALGEYRQAYDRLDARGARAVWPGVNERALARAFADLESQGLVFDRCDVNVGDDSATAACNGSARYVTKVGTRAPQVVSRHWTFTLRKSPNGWVIENVETRPQ